jgi:hypothetical protein
MMGTRVTIEEARRVGEQIGIDWASAAFDVDQFRAGMEVEPEHGSQDLATDVTHDDPDADTHYLDTVCESWTSLSVLVSCISGKTKPTGAACSALCWRSAPSRPEGSGLPAVSPSAFCRGWP